MEQLTLHGMFEVLELEKKTDVLLKIWDRLDPNIRTEIIEYLTTRKGRD